MAYGAFGVVVDHADDDALGLPELNATTEHLYSTLFMRLSTTIGLLNANPVFPLAAFATTLQGAWKYCALDPVKYTVIRLSPGTSESSVGVGGTGV
jgi:hypothetical protein